MTFVCVRTCKRKTIQWPEHSREPRKCSMLNIGKNAVNFHGKNLLCAHKLTLWLFKTGKLRLPNSQTNGKTYANTSLQVSSHNQCCTKYHNFLHPEHYIHLYSNSLDHMLQYEELNIVMKLHRLTQHLQINSNTLCVSELCCSACHCQKSTLFLGTSSAYREFLNQKSANATYRTRWLASQSQFARGQLRNDLDKKISI